MAVSKKICRLCMNTEAMTNLFVVVGDTTLDKQINFCIDLKMNVGDGLPEAICKTCEKNVKNFYDFKQKCLFVDSKLRTEKFVKNCYSPNKLTLDDTDLDSIKMDIKLECDIFNKMDSELKQTFDSWLSEDSDSTFYVDYFKNQIPCKIEDNESPTELPKNCNNQLSNDNEKKTQIKKQLRKKELIEPQMHQCEICGRIFKNKSILVKHVATHSDTKRFFCKICSKTFTRAEHKIVHMRTHLGIKPYICEVCGRSFTKSQDLNRHMRIHSDEKNYACSICDRRFKRSGDVHSHMRTHTGAKPYTCKSCEKSYTSHSGLRKHYKGHCKRENILIK